MPLSRARPLAVDAIIIKDNRILLIRRAHPPFKGEWALPGGFVEKGETLKEAVAREAKEETGLEVRPVNMIGVYDDPGRDPRGAVSAAYMCEVVSGEAGPSDESLEARFFSITEIPEGLAADHSRIVQDTLKLVRWW
jgi:8-oxo-dGTP diphosphatase